MKKEVLDKHKNDIKKYGFTILRDCFSKEEITEWKNKIVEYFSDESGNLTKNLNKNYRDGTEATRPLALADNHFHFLHALWKDNNCTKVLKYLTDDDLMYIPQDDVHVDTVAGKGWHRDSLNNSTGRLAPNWKDLYAKTDFWSQSNGESYQVYRIAIYCQDHIDNLDGLYVKANSHSHNPVDPSKVLDLYVKTRVGDVIIFDARLYHSGGSSNVSKKNYRTAIFYNAGKNNIFSKEHQRGALARQKYQLELNSYKISDELKEVLSKNNIKYMVE